MSTKDECRAFKWLTWSTVYTRLDKQQLLCNVLALNPWTSTIITNCMRVAQNSKRNKLHVEWRTGAAILCWANNGIYRRSLLLGISGATQIRGEIRADSIVVSVILNDTVRDSESESAVKNWGPGAFPSSCEVTGITPHCMSLNDKHRCGKVYM